MGSLTCTSDPDLPTGVVIPCFFHVIGRHKGRIPDSCAPSHARSLIRFKNIDDVLWQEASCTTELDYTKQSSWLLFLKYLDGLEQDNATEAELDGRTYKSILEEPYRRESWAAPKNASGKVDHNTSITGGALCDFVNLRLFPYLHGLEQRRGGPKPSSAKSAGWWLI